MRYTAVIGEAVAPRRPDPDAAARLHTGLDFYFRSLREERRRGIVSWPLLTPDGGFAALFSSCAHPPGVVDFLTELQELARPTRLRFGIGVGTLGADPTDDGADLDGPCQRRAQRALEASRQDERACTVVAGDELLAQLLSIVLAEMLQIRQGWSGEQREAIGRYLAMPTDSRSWLRVAEELGRSASAISQRKSGARWDVVRRMELVAARGLGELEAQSAQP